MKWKAAVRKVLPPFVADLYTHYRQGTRPGYIWKGVYSSYRDVPAAAGHFDSASWADVSLAAASAIVAERRQGTRWAPDLRDHAPLALLAAVVAGEHGSVAVLDYGGGAGEAFAAVAAGIGNDADIRYHVVETPAVCDAGRAIWTADPRIQFHAALPSGQGAIDIAYISSSLQYVEDYAGLLDAMCQYGPRYVLLAKLSAGAIPTYATAQLNRSGAAIPYWFINGDEIVERMRVAGYHLRLKSALDREYDQSNFPPQYRLGRTCNLLFSREGEPIA